jgi:hypothetical protein
MRILAVATAIVVLLPRVASADDASVDAASADATEATPVDAASDAPPPAACDGGLCDTQTGSTCAISSGSPGRSANGPTLTASLGALAVAAILRRRGSPYKSHTKNE